MFPSEAKWLVSLMGNYGREELSPLLNIGSGTSEYREIDQPFIEKVLFRSLKDRRIEIVHCDLKAGDGIDVSGDIYDPACRKRLHGIGAKALLCSNVLEHVKDPKLVSGFLLDILDPSGLLFITVPYSYPYHPDPIDTMFRPNEKQLENLFDGHDILHSEIVYDTTYWRLIRKTPSLLPRNIARIFIPFVDIEKWKSVSHNMLWLFKRYKLSCVIVRKTG